MKQTFLAIRAIATEFSHRIYVPVFITTVIVSILIIALLIWLLTINLWWLLLAIPLFIVILIVFALVVLAGILFKVIAPEISREQKVQISFFVDHVQELAEVTQTPKALLLYRIAKDAVSPKRQPTSSLSFLEQLD